MMRRLSARSSVLACGAALLAATVLCPSVARDEVMIDSTSGVTTQISTVCEPGNDVSLPTVIREVKPTYTLEAAAQARIQFASFGLA